MDANGARFWQLAGARQFPALRHAVWDDGCRRLRLASQRTLAAALPPVAAFAAAQAALDRVPRAVDALGSVARWDEAASAVVVRTPLPGGEWLPDQVLMPLAAAPTDLCSGADGVLYAALPGAVRLHDLRGRWADLSVSLAGLSPWRLAPAADGGVWAIERSGPGGARLARLTGRPVRQPAPQPDDYDGRVFRPSPENGCAPSWQLVGEAWPGSGRVLALASAPDGALAVLGWTDGDGHAALRRWLPAQQRWDAPLRLQGADYAHALAWLGPDRVAVRVPGRRDVPAFDLAAAAAGAVLPLGEVYPLPTAPGSESPEAPFCNGAVSPPRVPSGAAGASPLYPLSISQLARHGEAASFDAAGAGVALVDSGDATTVWHRLVAECHLPAQTGFVAWLAAGNEPLPPPVDSGEWHAHGFGQDIAALDDAMAAPQLPQAAWQREASELPGHPGLLGGARQPQVRGLFSVLVQNSRQRVRAIAGRYLWLRLVLHGNGRSGPEIAALRVWGGRFSYADRYLPRIYRETLSGDEATAPGALLGLIERSHRSALGAGGALSPALRARLALPPLALALGGEAVVSVEAPGSGWLLRDGAAAWRLRLQPDGIGVYRPQASPADFNERLLANFEGLLTPLEDRIVAAHLFSDPAAVPEASLDWLAGWIGVAFDPALPAARRRDWLRAAPDLARRHGSRDGLRLALDTATGGAVRSGSVLVVEDFRLRRILATLLGVDLADEHDPLLPGLQVSGNSVVGDTLVVGDTQRSELLALFDASVASDAENAAVIEFDRRLAHRATVLVHQAGSSADPAQDLALIRRIARLEAPAHVALRVVPASWPLMVGVASLVGVDTWLGPPRLPQPVQLQRSVLGGGDLLQVQPLLDPRLSGVPGGPTPLPVADGGPDLGVASDAPLRLDGSASRAGAGRLITEYRWRWLPPSDV